jgi:radical SAM protein with 4Fe4S-binding SPASM domain
MAESDTQGVEFMWYSPTPLCMFNPITLGLGNKGCSACDGLLSVDSGGNILPCSSCNDPVGNLLDSDFETVWRSSKGKAYRMKELAPPGCDACDNFAACHGACPLYWQHFGYDELCDTAGSTLNAATSDPRASLAT